MRILPTAAVVTLGVLLLSGCIPQEPVVTPAPESSAAPVFASEEEALAAAEKAYAEYLAVSDAIAADGGANPERIEGLVTPEQYEVEVEGFALYRSNQWHSSGQSAFESVQLQAYDEVGGAANLIMYVCSDLSGVHILDAAGLDVTPPEVPDQQALEVSFRNSEEGSSELLLESTRIWDSESAC